MSLTKNINIESSTLLEKSLEKNEKLIKANKPEGKLAKTILNSLLEHLNTGLPARSFERNSKEDVPVKNLFLLTDKPMIYVANIGENQISDEKISEIKKVADKNSASFVIINGKLESEMVNLQEEEKKLLLREYGLKEPGLNSHIRESYKNLGLQTFFTCG